MKYLCRITKSELYNETNLKQVQDIDSVLEAINQKKFSASTVLPFLSIADFKLIGLFKQNNILLCSNDYYAKMETILNPFHTQLFQVLFATKNPFTVFQHWIASKISLDHDLVFKAIELSNRPEFDFSIPIPKLKLSKNPVDIAKEWAQKVILV